MASEIEWLRDITEKGFDAVNKAMDKQDVAIADNDKERQAEDKILHSRISDNANDDRILNKNVQAQETRLQLLEAQDKARIKTEDKRRKYNIAVLTAATILIVERLLSLILK